MNCAMIQAFVRGRTDVERVRGSSRREAIPGKRPRLCIVAFAGNHELARLAQLELDDLVDSRIWLIGAAGSEDGIPEWQPAFDYALVTFPEEPGRSAAGYDGRRPLEELLTSAGLFVGRLGPEYTFLLHEQGALSRLPKILTTCPRLTYRHPRDQDLRGAIGPACTQIRLLIRSGYHEQAQPLASLGGVPLLNEELLQQRISEEVARQLGRPKPKAARRRRGGSAPAFQARSTHPTSTTGTGTLKPASGRGE
jgi:hypothetical protein